MELQAGLCYKQHRLEEARYEASRAADVCEKLGAVEDLERCRGLLQRIEEEMCNPVASGKSGFNRELLQMVLFPARIDFSI